MYDAEKERLIRWGSTTAKNGFQNERDVAEKFNKWKTDEEAKEWLLIMGFELEEIEYVKAIIIHGEKTDVQIQVSIKLKEAILAENIQVKLVSNPSGFNQIDKRWVDTYQKLWLIPDDLVLILKYFTGEILPYIDNPKNPRRMFFYEFPEQDINKVISFFSNNKALIINDLLRGRGRYAAQWMLVVHKHPSAFSWVLKPMNVAINHYSTGNVKLSPRGSLLLGKITMQRKGGDGGRPSACMLQFKVNPMSLFEC